MIDSSVREDIPLTRELVYFDNASTSLMPGSVLEAMNEYEITSRANVGRGVHRLSQISSQLFWDAHEKVKEFIGGKNGICIFCKNSTEAINQVAFGMNFESGDHIITTVLEHHSNILPWIDLRNKGVTVDFVSPDSEGFLDPDILSELIRKETRLIACTHVSNVLGTIQPVDEICSIAHDNGIKTLIDGAQSVPHIPVDVSKTGCDYLCFSGHKMLGPTGIGVLWMKEQDLKPMILGGGSIKKVSLDDYKLEDGYMRYEAGTPNITGAIGLRAAMKILTRLDMKSVHDHERILTDSLLKGMEDIEGVTIFGPNGTKNRLSVISFTIQNLHPHDTAHILDDQYDILVRSGHHCCMPLMDHMKRTEGTVRASLYLYNSAEEVERFLQAAREISEGI